MSRLTLILVMVAPLVVSMSAQTTPPQAPPASPPAEAAQSDATVAAETPSTVPPAESWLTGSIDVGYRWRTDVGGSLDTYRSIVNLGSGPKLLGADFTLTDPQHRAFDQIHVRANSWGDEPYQTVHIDAKKSKLYDFSADYRDFAYFDFLPSYADPLLARGIILNEQSFDTRRRLANFQIDLLPGNWFIPYFAYDRDSSSGTGATVFVTDANEFPVPNTLRDQTDLYRGGVRFELRRFHVTLEQGGTTFKDDQNIFQNPGSTNLGNVATPIFGKTTDLTNLLASYGVRGTSIYSKALFTASATSWLDLYGQFLYSQPDTNVNYQQTAAGNLLLQSQLLFYTSQQYLVSAAAKLPHTSGSLGAEIRPLRRVRIVQSWLTDRLHNAGSATSTQTLAATGVSEQMAALLASSLVTNYSQEEIDVIFDATSKVTLRGGYRYVWGDANDAVLPPEGLVSSDQAKLRRNVGIGEVAYHPTQKISIRTDAEVASSGGAYFRTSLYDYQKVHAQVRYQALTNLSLAADFTLLDNNNPVPGVNYDYRSQQESLSLFWSPAGGKFGDFQGSYTRSTLHSDSGYLVPQTLTPQTSLYTDNAHTATALFNVKLPHVQGIAPKLSAGGSLFVSSGSRATSYYQPLATLWLPISKKISLFADWRYYGYGEAFYLYEGFRTNLVTTGLRFTR
ncbi:MAG TPA: hypothetical protein VGQ49_24920 [Bryobacteraceae bacterium]|jgi:hypothetical protein|nr:hypothetical protein [Bryobacteraceae bacterium]